MHINHRSSYHHPRKSWSIYEISFSKWNENAAAIAWATCQRYWNSGMAFRTRVLFPSPFRSISSFSFPCRSPRSTGPERWKNNAYTTRTPFVSIEHGVSLHPCLLSFLASLVHRFWRRRRPLFFSSLQFYSGFLSFLATRSHRILLHAAAAAASRLVPYRVSCLVQRHNATRGCIVNQPQQTPRQYRRQRCRDGEPSQTWWMVAKKTPSVS